MEPPRLVSVLKVIVRNNMSMNSLGTALRKKITAPVVKAIRHFPDKHHKYKMEKLDKDYAFLKGYNDREKSGVGNSDKDRAIFQIYKDRK
jgi:hypothetical protein